MNALTKMMGGRKNAPAKAERTEPVSILSVIASAASDPNVQPEKMQKLLDMQMQIMAEEARIAFNSDFIAMSSELPSIAKRGKIIIRDKNNPEIIKQTTPYATFNDINKAIAPILQKHGFALAFSTAPGPDGRINVVGTLKHIKGHQETTTFPLPLETSGSKNNVQGVGSSTSYGKRYAAIALLNIVSEDDDDAQGNETDPLVTKEQAGEMATLIAENRVALPAFLDHYGIEKLADMPAAIFPHAKKKVIDAGNARRKKGAD